jgi:hypothetical protein
VVGGSQHDGVAVETDSNGSILRLWSTPAVLRHRGGGGMVRQGANRGIKRCVVLFTKNGGSSDGSSKCGGGNGGPAVGLDRRSTRGVRGFHWCFKEEGNGEGSSVYGGEKDTN